VDFRAVAASPEQGARRSVYSYDRNHNHAGSLRRDQTGCRRQTSRRPKARDGLIRLWLDRKFVGQLAQIRAKGESYSDVILRLAKT
jgi:hypothetical protein